MKRVSLFILSLLFLATALQSDKILTSGWYQQFLPAGGYKPIAGMVFVDSLTGFIVTGADTVGNTNYIFKTTDGGDNWAVNATITDKFYKLQFINDSTGLAIANNKLFKTFNKGINWNYITMPIYPIHMYVLNKDTIFGVDGASIMGGFWRTTNGGTSWVKLVNFGSNNPSKVYFYNKNIGFLERFNANEIYKTTNGGFNWFFASSGDFFTMHFFDSLNGYKSDGGVKKTTDGGLNWIAQQSPNITDNGFGYITVINKDTIWGIGGSVLKNNKFYGVVYKTTNGGNNWGYQIPLDTNSISQYFNIASNSNSKIWAYFLRNTGVHTKVGGNDTTFFTGIKLVPNFVPEKFSLGQNYPNPFNPTTNIPFELKEPSHVTLKVFDVQGREVKELINGRWGSGKFIADFDASSLTTGIYFYQIIVSGESTRQTFTATKKLILIK